MHEGCKHARILVPGLARAVCKDWEVCCDGVGITGTQPAIDTGLVKIHFGSIFCYEGGQA
ncbi:MAG TPA: hypothetical protein ENG03_12470 [Thioploca sp.]|nr:hypothetical protein [Thioploca sp.]